MVLKNLMLMVTSKLIALVKKISIQKLSNHGLHQQMLEMLNQDGTKILTP